jgi:hypothetical protein
MVLWFYGVLAIPVIKPARRGKVGRRRRFFRLFTIPGQKEIEMAEYRPMKPG